MARAGRPRSGRCPQAAEAFLQGRGYRVMANNRLCLPAPDHEPDGAEVDAMQVLARAWSDDPVVTDTRTT